MKPSTSSRKAITLALMIAPSIISAAETITLQFYNGDDNNYTGCKDISVRSNNPDTVATGAPIGADQGSPRIHSLVKFEGIFGDGINQIPLGSRIVSAKLTGYSQNKGNPPRFHRVLIDWEKAKATYNDPFLAHNGQPGIQADNFESTASYLAFGSTNIPNSYHTFDITQFVQTWSDGAPNFGFAWLPTGSNAYTIQSSEHENPLFRPTLEVTFVAATSALEILDAVELSFSTVPDMLYQLQVSVDMKTWLDIGDVYIGDGNRHSHFERRQKTKKFYRILEISPADE